MKKIIINESQLETLKMPRFLYKAIVNKNTSIGDNPAIPNYGEFGFLYDLIKKQLGQVNDSVDDMIENGELKSKETDYLISHLSKLTTECKRIEKTLKPQLEKICENIVNAAFSIPVDTVIIKCHLTDKIVPKNAMRILPESNVGGKTYDFEDVAELDLTNKAILKRRFVNTLIQGFSYWLSNDLSQWYYEFDSLNDNLLKLWSDIIRISDYLLYTKEEKISEKNPMQQSYVEVHLGKRDKKTIIDAQGIIFPYLLRDTFRGLFELFSSHGLPDDNDKAMYIIRKSDFILAEPWDLRIGIGLMNVLYKNITDKYDSDILKHTNRIPFLFTKLCELKIDDFNDVMSNVIIGSKKGKRIISAINHNIIHDMEYQTFKDKIQKKNVNTSLIQDDCFTSDELTKYTLEENGTDDEHKSYYDTSINDINWFRNNSNSFR